MDFIGKNIINNYLLKNLVNMENKEVLHQGFKNKIPEVDFSKNQ